VSQTTSERRSALDQFAQQAGQVPATVPAQPYQPPAEIIQHGAQQIAVYRDPAKARAVLKARAASAGEKFYYRWPVKNKRKGTTDWVEGPSIKCANAALLAYGNCRAYVANVQDLGTHWRFSAVFIDFETGTELGRSFIQRKSGGTMGDDPERKLDVAYQIGESKALRNVIANALEELTDFAMEEAKASMVAKIGDSLDRYRKTVPARIAEWNVDIKRVEAVVGRPAKDWLAPDVARVIAMMNAIGDGMATIDESFPPLTQERDATSEKLDQFSQSEPSGPSPSGGKEEAGASPRQAADASANPSVEDMRDEAIDIAIRIAKRFDIDEEDRLLHLENIVLPEGMQFYPEMAKAVVTTAAKVVRKEITPEAARKYLGSLPMKRRDP
jgi:hypothetical protein